MEEGQFSTIAWGVFEFNSENIYMNKDHGSPYNLESRWSKNVAREEDLLIIVRTSYLEVIAVLETHAIIARIQL